MRGPEPVLGADAAALRDEFDGVLDEAGYVWGRGALDMKNEVATRAVALAALARSGEPLEGDVVFVWSTTVHGRDERVHSDDLGCATPFAIEAWRSLLGASDQPGARTGGRAG